MEMGLDDDIVRALVSQAPRRAADAALGLLVSHLGADGAACFRIEQDRVSLFASRGVDQVALDRVATTWEDCRDAIRSGQVFDADARFAVVPVSSDGVALGLLYVDADRGLVLDRDVVERLLPLLRAALSADATGAVPLLDAYIERTPPAQFQREQLLLLLERNEWNIARVARLKGVTRLTVYEQMRRWGIERVKVVKNSGLERATARSCRAGAS
jgi:hypothetical protein